MTTIIDRYLLRQFFWVFVIFFCSLFGLFVVADSVNNFEELSGFARDHGGLLKVIGEYYGYRSLAFFDHTSAVLIMISAMFTIAAFRRHNEMTALLAAGISKTRIVRPVLIVAALMSLFAAASRELIIPKVREKLSFNAQDLTKQHLHPLQPRYDNDTDILMGGEGVNRRQKRIAKPNFFLPTSLDHYGRQLVAMTAVYQAPVGQRPGGYLMTDVVQPKGLDKKPSLLIGQKPVILTPADNDWLKAGECFVASGVEFDQLAAGRAWKNMASTRELIAGINNRSLRHGANVEVEVHTRFVQPVLDMTLLFLGLPLVLSRQTHNIFVSVGVCVLLVALFMMVALGAQHLGGNATLSPAFAAWLPVLIFVPVAVGLSDPLRE